MKDKIFPSRSGYDTATAAPTIRFGINPARYNDDGTVRCRARSELRATSQHDMEHYNLARVINNADEIEPKYRELCKEVAKRRGHKRVPKKWLSEIPTARKLRKLAKDMRRDGYDLTGLVEL